MDVEQALAELMEVSSQVETAVVLDAAGTTLGSTGDRERAERLARAARELLAGEAELGPGGGERRLAQLEAATLAGSVFVVADGGRVVAATTAPAPTAGLVFYDLKTCLRALHGDGGERS